MINTFQRTNIATIKDDLTLELFSILLDVNMLNKNYDHIHIIQKIIEAIILINCNLMIL